MKKILKITEQQNKMLKKHILLTESMSWKMGSRRSLPLKERDEIKKSLKILKEDEINISEMIKVIEKYDCALNISENEIIKLKETLNKIM